MKNVNLLFRILLILAIPTFFACEGDDTDVDNPVDENEEELITVLNVTLINAATLDTTYAVFSDVDGPGGNAPVITPIILQYDGTNTQYIAQVEVLDSSNPNDVEDITLEIVEEADEHQFFYIPNSELPKL